MQLKNKIKQKPNQKKKKKNYLASHVPAVEWICPAAHLLAQEQVWGARDIGFRFWKSLFPYIIADLISSS